MAFLRVSSANLLTITCSDRPGTQKNVHFPHLAVTVRGFWLLLLEVVEQGQSLHLRVGLLRSLQHRQFNVEAADRLRVVEILHR